MLRVETSGKWVFVAKTVKRGDQLFSGKPQRISE